MFADSLYLQHQFYIVGFNFRERLRMFVVEIKR